MRGTFGLAAGTVLAAVLPLSAADAGESEKCPVSANVRGHENTEWSRSYAYHLADGRRGNPRVLLVGDSIVADYEGEVRRALDRENVNVSYWISSYCVTSPRYRAFLDIYLAEAKYDVVHFNNGLHSLGTDTRQWSAALEQVLRLVRERQPGARIVWCTSTPLKSEGKTAKVRELNDAAEEVVARMGGVETDDLFALLDPLDREAHWRDEFHHKPDVSKMEGGRVAKAVLAALERGKTPSATTGAVRPRDVPELMTTRDGGRVETTAQWERVRAPEILETYRREVFGVRPPEVEDRARVSFRAVSAREVFGGTADQKVVEVRFAGDGGVFSFPFTVVIPTGVRPVPAFVCIGLAGSTLREPDGAFRSPRWPAEAIVGRGYATAYFCNADVADDAPAGLGRGIFAAVGGQTKRNGAAWGTISAWAWAASRVMDWMETEEAIDAAHIGVVGHSRCGKTAIWAGVNDNRFAMVCSNDSGCSGAKLNHIDLPLSESVAQIMRGFPYWFCPNYLKYAERELQMPFDQHELLALVAPRLLCVASATRDHWAGPVGEWWAAKLASPAWRLYGKKGLEAETPPPPDAPQANGSVAYYLRSGAHDLGLEDWTFYMDFADRRGWRGK